METKTSHIVFLTPGFAKSETDSTTIPALQVYLKSLKLILPNTQLTLITFQFPFSNKPYKWHGINVIPLNGKNEYLKKLWTWKKALLALNKIHLKNPITTVHSFWIGECSLIGSRFSKKHNIKHITTVMGQDANLNNSYVKPLKNSDTKIVTLSKNHNTTLFKHYKLDSVIIPWDLDSTTFPELQESTIDILGVGSLNKVKNYSVFMTIIANLVKTNPNLKAEIIGEGSLRVLLEKQIEFLKLKNNITLIGQLPRQAVLKKMSQAKVLLHTSKYESFGYVFLEALYSGMQIVSFDVGIAQSIETWRICDFEKEMLETLKNILNDPKTPNKQRVSLNKYDSGIQSYLKLYNE
ncbi:glycosyltransferase [Winogradskyella eximia]|uniref:glycosyltransferase n=1 Tax=Winogradskyella eximia TaxID=262006 RepID=UPI00248FE2F7|nr:glycosyltransferase [Winogradskyella eximia]